MPPNHPPFAPQHDTYDYGRPGSVSWFTRLLWYAAGADAQLLMRCPLSDRVKYQGLGGVVFATAMLAFASGSYAFYVVFGPKEATALDPHAIHWQSLAVAMGFGLLWSLIIFNIDRFIVASSGKGDGTEKITFQELVNAIPRIIMAVIIGLCLSAPLEIRILKTEIDTELASRQKAERLRLDKQTDARIDKRKQELQGRIQGSRVRLSKRTTQYEKRRTEILAQRRKLELEAEGASGSGKAGRGPAWRDKKENLDRLEKDLGAWKKDTAEQDKPAKDDIAHWKTELAAIAAEVKREKADNARSAAKMDGLMMRIHISHEIGGWVPIMIMLLLLSIEVGPIFFKMMLVAGAYDYLTENQKRLAAARFGVEPAWHKLSDGKVLELQERYHAVDTVLARERLRLQHEAQLTGAVYKAWGAQLEAEIAANPEDFVDEPDGFGVGTSESAL